jgi:hypothetical protein
MKRKIKRKGDNPPFPGAVSFPIYSGTEGNAAPLRVAILPPKSVFRALNATNRQQCQKCAKPN